MSFEIKRATRQGVIPLIGLYSESGCGKTMSALLMARGLVGPSGEIHLIDTESRRGSLYADVIPGGFNVIDMESSFTPGRYIEALDTIYKAGGKVAVIDSMSHEWEGIGGVCDQADAIESEKGKSLNNWRKPKMEHAKLVQHLLRSPIPVICCIRAKFKTRQTKENGKTIIAKDQCTSPIQSDDFIFEMTAHGEILPDHSIDLRKCSHPDLRKCFPEKGPIKIEHGEMIAKWCAGSTTTPISRPNIAVLKKQLWDMTANVNVGTKEGLNQWLWDEALMDTDIQVSTLNETQLGAVISKVSKKLSL